MHSLAQNYAFGCLFVFLLVVFMTGGGARADIQSLVVLRPVAAVVLCIGLWGLKLHHIREYRFLFGMAAAILALVAIHLIPLPPSVWGAFPGREVVSEVDRLAGIGDVWRPISLVPSASWNSLFSLIIPLAVLVLAVQLQREQRFQLLAAIIALGLFSGLWGLLQAIGPSEGPLYLYRITNNGSAVGLFSNRNHQAVFLALLFPMLAVFASSGIRTVEHARLYGWLAVAACVILIPLLLVTGSRAGLVAGVLGLGFALVLYRRPEISQPKKRKDRPRFDPRLLIGGFGAIMLGALTFLMARARAVDRLSIEDEADDLRFRMWGPIAEMAEKYFPLGSGAGSFVEIYQVGEPDNLLKVNYVNHAHNDWLETFLTLGLPGLLLLGVAIVAFVTAAWRYSRSPLWDRRTSYGRMGAVVLFLLALASVADYPLRVPSLACVFVIACIWLASPDSKLPKNAGTS